MSPLSQSLAALAQQQKLAGSLASFVRAEMPAIEAARQAGLSYAQICKGLEALGLATSARTLRHTVYRIQAEQRRSVPTVPRTTQALVVNPSLAVRSSSSASAPPPRAQAPSKDKPNPAPQATSASTDSIPLMEVRSAQALSTAAPVDFIAAIRQSSPDLDVLADRYRQSLRGSAATASNTTAPPTLSGGLSSTPSSPGSTSSS